MKTLKLNETQQEEVNRRIKYCKLKPELHYKLECELLEKNNVEEITMLITKKIEYWKYNLWLKQNNAKCVWSISECKTMIEELSENISL